MAYTAHRDTRYGYYGGNSLPYSQATPQPYSPRTTKPMRLPHWVPTAGLPVHSSGYATQWNAPTLHSSVQDQRYGWPVPYVNGVAGSYSVWTDAQQSASFAPVRAMNAVTPYQNQSHYRDTDNAPNGPMAYHEDNRTPASRDRNGWVTAGVRSRGVVDYGPTLARASTNSAAGNDVQFLHLMTKYRCHRKVSKPSVNVMSLIREQVSKRSK
ncbi:hypothetical protein BJV77DRAFT_343433 [Russula vinacea]|nr:hypothetical protein BJV77DRAFT_343433 [Russula vinacea]